MQLILKIRLYGHCFGICYIFNEEIFLPDKRTSSILGLEYLYKSDLENVYVIKPKSLYLVTNAYFLLPFLNECANSKIYRTNFLKNVHQTMKKVDNDEVMHLTLKLETPDKEIIDFAWNERILRLIWTRVEIENAFSWLSTLGGAYSALGDHFEHCAEEAGRISIRQYQLSKILGDESLAARSYLYMALSQSQKGNLKTARHIVRCTAVYARETHDRRLLRMCHGIWAKLKYLRSLANGSSSKITTSVNGNCETVNVS